MQQCHIDSMSVQITIRNVSEEVRDQLAVRAAMERKSMQEFLRGELDRLAMRPSIETWLNKVRERKGAVRNRVSPKEILRHRDADRR